jgi:hypothetical protein
MRCVSTALIYAFIISFTMAHHDISIRECVAALGEKGGLSASAAGELYSFPRLQQGNGYGNTRRMG